MPIFPKKLTPGDEVRIVSPAMSMGIIAQDVRKTAVLRLEELGLKVTFSKHCEEIDEFLSSSIQSRVDDLHEAFSDPKVRAILTTIGGFNSIQLLQSLDYSLIQKNPKILCGYSDISTLQNAIFAKTGLVTYSGPHFSTFGCLKGLDYVIEYFKKCLFDNKIIHLPPSPSWSDDLWYLDQERRTFEPNPGYLLIHPGQASGTILGGNINALNNLQGTDYMPSLQDSILFLEDDHLSTPEIFDRCLQSLILQEGFEQVRAVVIGRFQKASKMSEMLLKKIVDSKKELDGILVIACVDFGHTLPMFTFPVGGHAELDAHSSAIHLRISNCP